MPAVIVDSPSEYMLYLFYRLSARWPTVLGCDSEGQVYRRCPHRIPARTARLWLYPGYDQYVVHQLLRQPVQHVLIEDSQGLAQVSGCAETVEWVLSLPALSHRVSGRLESV